MTPLSMRARWRALLALAAVLVFAAFALADSQAAGTTRAISTGAQDVYGGFKVRASTDGLTAVIASDGTTGSEPLRFAFSAEADARSFADDFRTAVNSVTTWATSATTGTVRRLSTGAVDKQVPYRIRLAPDSASVVVAAGDGTVGAENPRLVFTGRTQAIAAADQFDALADQIWPAAPTPTPTPTPTPPPTNPTPTGTKVFDGSRLSAWSQLEAAPDRITEVSDPLGGGGTVFKFTVNDSDTILGQPNPRAQLQTPDFINPGDEIWYGGRVLFPADFPDLRDVSSTNRGWVSTGSVFGPPYAGSSPITQGINRCTCNSEPFWGEDNDGWSTRYWGVPQSQMRGHWITWLVHARFATDGWREVWVDGVKVMPRRSMALVDSSNDGGPNHVTQNFYRLKSMWPGSVTMYHADFGVWRVNP